MALQVAGSRPQCLQFVSISKIQSTNIFSCHFGCVKSWASFEVFLPAVVTQQWLKIKINGLIGRGLSRRIDLKY